MVLTTKERQRRFRERLKQDPERYEEFKQKMRQRYHDQKAAGKITLIDTKSERNKRSQRKYWRQQKRKQRSRQKDLEKELTPPSSPSTPASKDQEPPAPSRPQPSRQKEQSKRERKRKDAKCYRDKNSLQMKLDSANKKLAMYRKRIQRMKDALSKDSPKTKTKKLLRHLAGNNSSLNKVRRSLEFHYALIKQLRLKYKLKENKKKVSHAVIGSVIRKYKALSYIRSEIGIRNPSKDDRKKKKGTKIKRLRVDVQQFFERDDNSRITTGVRQTVTKLKDKRQKRLLLDTIENLYEKYRREAKEAISFTTFWRLKPFWVKQKTEKERETCLCKTCENLTFMATALYKHKAIKTFNIEVLVTQVVCNPNNKDCMFGNCSSCKEKQVETNIEDFNTEISWNQWKTEKEKRTFKNGEIKEVTVTKKTQENGSLGHLMDRFHDDLWIKGRKHLFIVKNQMNHYRKLKESLGPNECLLHVDFAENYVGKMEKEIQSVHFGASQNQITLHTGYYITGTMNKLQSFCGISDSLQHDPYSIWAHLNPVLSEIREKYPEVDTVHFYSDGPTTQYKQKLNFHILSNEIFSYGFTQAQWNFHAAGHGKGIPDGIGAALKRSADQKVKHGADILNADSFLKEMKTTNTLIQVYLVRDVDIHSMEAKYKNPLLTVPGTTKLHQIFIDKPDVIKYRDVSCVCYKQCCKDHQLQTFSLLPGTKAEESKRVFSKGKSETNQKQDNSFKDIPITDEKKKQTTLNGRTNEDLQEVRRKEGTFRRILKSLQARDTFINLKKQCAIIKNQIGYTHGTPRSYHNFQAEPISQSILPNNISVNGDTAVKVKADGDCLPACGSVFAYGNDLHVFEMRTRIVAELTLNEEYYLNETNLIKGEVANTEKVGSLIKAYAMYSEEYMHDGKLTSDKIRDIYEREVLKITKEKVYMGIWQIHALSSVLGMSLRSIYPELGNPVVRRHLNRTVEPRINEKRSCVGQIFWTTTRSDMQNQNWIPNHFVPILPETCNTSVNEIEKKTERNTNAEIKELYHKFCEQTKSTEVSIDGYLGKYVLITYNDQYYPGLVNDIDFESQMVFIECMVRIGSKNENCFFWPKKIHDKNWYELDEIRCMISEPEPIEGTNHFAVKQSEWEDAKRP